MTGRFPLLMILSLLPAPSLLQMEGVFCTSLPALEPLPTALYFACTCDRQDQVQVPSFSLANFANNLSNTIFDRELVVDFRDCWAISITFDQLQLNLAQSHMFRPDMQFREVNVENMYQVHLSQDLNHQRAPLSDYINRPTHPLTVTLYDVNKVTVDSEAMFERLVTDWDRTQLTVDLTNSDTPLQDHTFDVEGFLAENILLVTDNQALVLAEQSENPEFRALMWDLRRAVVARARQMSLGLVLCVFILSLGLGVGMLAMVRRHQLVIESVIYGSIGSLRRMRGRELSTQQTSDSDKEVTTTTTQVDFFPRYSVVNKSQKTKGRKGEGREKIPHAPPIKQKSENMKSRKEEVEVQKEKKPHVIQASAIYDVFSTLKFKRGRKPLPPPVEIKVPQEQEKSVEAEKNVPKPAREGSFYYQNQSLASSGSSIKYDLTVGHTCAQVHTKSEPKDSHTKSEPKDPHTTSMPQVSDQEKVYSFRALREKCRSLISRSKTWQDNTKL